MLKALVADDEFPAREELVCVLEECEGIEVVGICEDGAEVLTFLQRQPVDVVFLDIQMPSLNGISVAGQLGRLPKAPRVIFVTGYSEYAVKAFEVNAADYLLKPYTVERVCQAVAKLKEPRRQEPSPAERLQPGRSARLPVWVNDRMLLIKPEDVLFAKADGKRSSRLYTNRGEFACGMTLRELEEKLGGDVFIRTHKSYLVNTEKIDEIIPWFNHTYVLVLQGCPVRDIPVARHFLPEFNIRMRLKEYK